MRWPQPAWSWLKWICWLVLAAGEALTGMVTRLSCSRPDQLARPRALAEPVMAGTVVVSVAIDGADIFFSRLGIKILVGKDTGGLGRLGGLVHELTACGFLETGLVGLGF